MTVPEGAEGVRLGRRDSAVSPTGPEQVSACAVRWEEVEESRKIVEDSSMGIVVAHGTPFKPIASKFLKFSTGRAGAWGAEEVEGGICCGSGRDDSFPPSP